MTVFFQKWKKVTERKFLTGPPTTKTITGHSSSPRSLIHVRPTTVRPEIFFGLASNPSLVSARPMSILLTVQPSCWTLWRKRESPRDHLSFQRAYSGGRKSKKLKISTFLFQLGHPNMIKRSSTLMYHMLDFFRTNRVSEVVKPSHAIRLP